MPLFAMLFGGRDARHRGRSLKRFGTALGAVEGATLGTAYEAANGDAAPLQSPFLKAVEDPKGHLKTLRGI